jgi:hypothetical protein
METVLRLAGAAQLVLALASLAIPHVLGWAEEARKLRPLTRQVFWTYAAYIWAFNVSFGLVSATLPGSLLDGSTLARGVCGFIGAYWGARLLLQFFYFDRAELAARAVTRLAEAALVCLFAGLVAVYMSAAFGGGR